MKFLISKNLSKQSPIFPPLVGLLLFFLIGIAYNFAYIHSKISLVPQTILENILGDEEAFIEPILPEELLAIVHVELLFFMFVLPLLFFIHYRLHPNGRIAKELVVAFSFIQCAMISLAFSQAVGVWFVYIFLGSFFAANAMLLHIVVRTFWRLMRDG